eukprot:3276235-Alexandrium_andersonii.AAC.1
MDPLPGERKRGRSEKRRGARDGEHRHLREGRDGGGNAAEPPSRREVPGLKGKRAGKGARIGGHL